MKRDYTKIPRNGKRRIERRLDAGRADLASNHGSVLAKVDWKIPGAFVIPELPEGRAPKL